MKKKKSHRNRSRQAILVALLLSLLLHQLLLTGLGSILSFPEEPAEEERHEVTLREEPPPEPETPAPKPEKAPPKPEPIPVAKPLPRPAPRVAPAPAPQPPKPPASEPAGEPEADETAITAVGPTPEPHMPSSPPKLDLTWKSFDKLFGAQAARDREAYAEQALEKRRNRGAMGNYSARVLRAVNNHQSFIKAGQQEPLGPRKAIFHNYIDAIHEASIHPKFADSFLASLPALSGSDPLNNPDLMMVAEFEIFESGNISDIHVVKASGNLVFDAGAVDSIFRSAPFPAPPKEVLSWNRRVYIRWGFYRNSRKCGVFNVEPYILRAPGGPKEDLPVDKFTVTGG